MYNIYILIDPTDNLVKYVGRVKSGRESMRLSEHFYRSDRHEWIQNLKNLGIKPVLDIIDANGSYENEEFYTDYFRFIGMPLTNKRSGNRRSASSIDNQRKSLIDGYRSGRLKPPYAKGSKKPLYIGRKISATKKNKISK